jgi:FkbM family methyltransferase
MSLNLLNSWTVSFVREWWPHMTLRSVVRCRDYCLRLGQDEGSEERTVLLNATSPIHADIVLREVFADWWTFEEIVQEQVYKNILSHLSHCETIIDLGANIGLATLYFASQYSASQLFAVEPNPANYALLNVNLQALVDSGRCQTLNAAIWQQEMLLVANPLPSPNRYNCFSVREPLSGEPCSIPLIKGMPIESVISASGFSTVDILKVDIEGAEVQLFRGNLDWLKRVRALLIEFHDESRQKSDFDAIMRRYHFRIPEENRHTVFAVNEA